jgi:hypothetical protein
VLSLEREPTKIRLTSTQLFYYDEQSICKSPTNYTNIRYVFSCIFFYEGLVIRITMDAADMSRGSVPGWNILFVKVAYRRFRTVTFGALFYERSLLESNAVTRMLTFTLWKPVLTCRWARKGLSAFISDICASFNIFIHADSDKWDGAYRPAFDQEAL